MRGLRPTVLLQLPLATLSGIESLQHLEVLYIYMLGRLEGSPRSRAFKRLKTLSIEPRGNADLEPLGDIGESGGADLTGATPRPWYFLGWNALKRLNLTKRREVALHSRSLRSMKALRELWLVDGTTVDDGDMSILLELPALTRVSFQQTASVHHRHEDVQQTLLARATTGVGAFDNAMAACGSRPCRYESP